MSFRGRYKGWSKLTLVAAWCLSPWNVWTLKIPGPSYDSNIDEVKHVVESSSTSQLLPSSFLASSLLARLTRAFYSLWLKRKIRACLHGGGRPHVGKVTHFKLKEYMKFTLWFELRNLRTGSMLSVLISSKGARGTVWRTRDAAVLMNSQSVSITRYTHT